MKKVSQKLTPCIWFNNQAEEAANFYVRVFNMAPESERLSKVETMTYYDEASAKVSGQPKGTVLTVSYILAGQSFMALNGGTPESDKYGNFKLTSAISFVINCETQAEVDWFWKELSAGGGKTDQCGWLTDKYCVTWQVVPTILGELLAGKDQKKAERVMKAMLEMTKLDIEGLKNA